MDTGEEHTFGIDPLPFHIGCADADEDRSGRAQSHKLMRVHGEVLLGQRPGVFDEVRREPVILA